MKKIKLLIAAMLMLSSCSTNLEVLQTKSIDGKDFNSIIARKYRSFAKSEEQKYDWVDSAHFAKKGLMAANNKNVVPEKLDNWKIFGEHRKKLIDAREHLMNVLTSENKVDYPKSTAEAQFYYDCWVEEQEENWQPEDISYCKHHFMDSIDNLERSIKAKFTNQELKIQHYHTVYFDFDRAELNSTEEEILKQALDASLSLPDHNITLSGFADNTGSNKYNDQLSLNRALAVKRYLQHSGIDKEIFIVENFGKHLLAVPTPFGVKERLNRRVEIFIHY